MLLRVLKEELFQHVFTFDLLYEQGRSSRFARQWYFFDAAFRHWTHLFGVDASHKSVPVADFAGVICQNPALFQAYPAKLVKLELHTPIFAESQP